MTALPAGVAIRLAAGTDVPFIRMLGDAAFGEYDRRAGEYSVAASARATTLVAERAGESLGFAVVERDGPGSFHLAAIAVTESARGMGVGSALLRAAEAHAKSHGGTKLHLTTADSNVAALSVFQKAGLRQTRGGEGTYRRGQRSVRMEKTLGA
ncbi:MAG TPA: GNAT family N-acetyltransferase [Polyangiaceae bacterium]|nr:GNAT family N-acetyltransferase [Polyangiaceae bacterium]